MADLITITVDGREVQVPPRLPLIEALRHWAKVDTPAFCYHPDLKVAGNCRICLVETEGPRGWALGISCHMQTAPGLKVRTPATSPTVAKARKGVMEFLLVNHPLDCPICDKAGECSLQEHYMGQGRHESRLRDEVGKAYKGGADHRFTDAKGQERGGKHIDLGPSIILDQERCIVCTRCVRFMDEVAKDRQLEVVGRGEHAYLTTFPGKPLDHAYDLCTTDVCPVGALTGKHFRFQQRVWMLHTAESIDPSDAFGANLAIEYGQGPGGGRVWRLMPRRNPEVNKSWLANRSRLLYRELGRNRLTDGLRAGAACTLAEARSAAKAALVGARRVALVASGHATIEDNAALLALAAALGAKAEVFGGSWLPVGRPDGIALSGDPVANRAGLKLLGIPDNLDELARRAGEFDCLLAIHHDLWGGTVPGTPENAAGGAAREARAQALAQIPSRIALSAWRDATAAQATVALGVRAWAEVRGVMVNATGRAQLMQACPVLPDPALEPAWRELADLAGLGWTAETQAWAEAQRRAPALQGLTYRAIGPMGAVPAAAPAAAGGG